MRYICPAGIIAPSLLLIFAGCQHLPPRPLNLPEIKLSLKERPVDVAPVRAYADALAIASAESVPTFDTSDGLNLNEGLAVALWYNPDLRIARIEMEQASAIAQTSGRWVDPELNVSGGRKEVTENTTESVTVGQGEGEKTYTWDVRKIARSWISIGSLSITVPVSGRLRVEKKLHQSEYYTHILRVAEAELFVLEEARNGWAHWSASQERIKLLDEYLALLGRFAQTAESLAKVGELPSSNARLFMIEQMRKEAERDRERANEAERRVSLLQTLGLLPDAAVELVPQLSIVYPPEVDILALDEHPTIKRVRAEYQSVEDRLKVELRKQYPDLTFSPTYTEEKDESSFVLGFGFPLPVWNANRQGIAEAAGARDIARAKFEMEYQRLIAEVAQARAALAGSRAQRTRLMESVVPVIDQQMSEVLALIDILLLYETLTQMLETQKELLNAALAEALAVSRLAAVVASDATAISASVEVEH